MNFLAHLYLSGSSEPCIIGNFIGDFVKGNQYLEFPREIQQGILLHREIDRYTDEHEVNKKVRKLLSPYFRHYSGVVQDLYWDHFLAKHWDKYHPMHLPDFTNYVYKILTDQLHELPRGVQQMLPHMIQGNWLLSYADTTGIEAALKGLSRRTKFTSNMEEGGQVLRRYYDELEEYFFQFIPEVQDFVSQRNPDFPVT